MSLKLIAFTTSLSFLVWPSVSLAANLTASVPIDPSRAAAAISQPFVLQSGASQFTAPAAVVKTWFKTTNANDQSVLQLRPGAIYDYLNTKVSPVVNQPGVASRFAKINGKINQISAGKKGQIVDGVKTSLAIREALVAGQPQAKVFMKTDRPAIFSAADFAKLSFPQLLASGETNFAGSPANRVHNIQIATKRFNGLVLMPGEQFSFNQHLGTVDATNGYKPELVIKQNVTTPEYGGGICQVSTTAFRAALKAGLKITAWRNHSYPVRYYGPPGFDATVYAPSTDLKFVNDLPHPIYLKTSIQGSRLIFDFYGKPDGRQVTINGPFTTERFPNGNLTAAVAQIVKKGGKSIREQNFVSRYQSPDKFPTIRAANNG